MKSKGKSPRRQATTDLLKPESYMSESRFVLAFGLLMLCFGIYQSIIYWGHQEVPHFDFHCFVSLAGQLFSFEIPSTFKRVPLTGILQVILGYITGGTYPPLTGGWLLNAICHTLTAVLLWLVGRKVIGKAAIWLAIIAVINPWGIRMMTEAIAETPLLFFIWVTLYFIFKRSRWAYLFASLCTMARYEGAALILGAFVYDMIDGRDRKYRLMSFFYAAMASVPLCLWMLGTVLTWSGEGATHYLKIFSKDYTSGFADGVKNRIGIGKHLKILWEVGFYPLFAALPTWSKGFTAALYTSNQILAAASFLFGTIYGLYKKQWTILVLLIFLLPYFWIHSKYPYPIHRYHATIFAIVMLICFYGIISFFKCIADKIPKTAVVVMQSVVIIVSIVWAVALMKYLPRLSQYSRDSVSLPYVSVVVGFIALALGHYVYRKNLLRNITIYAVLVLIVFSNQFTIASIVGNGERDIEFKYLTDWYKANAKQGEKMVTTVPIILTVMAPEFKENFIHTNTFDANTPEEFVRECYQRNITYIAWDSRMGLTPKNHYYKYWNMSNIAPLIVAKDIGPYKFITRLIANKRRYINLYRLRPPAAQTPQSQK